MHTEFRKALQPKEIRSLVAFDHKAFSKYQADWFRAEDWPFFEAWWLLVDKKKVGCCAFERNVDFLGDVEHTDTNPKQRGSLYIATTGVLPAYQGLGYGNLLKCWQVSYARRHGFARMITNTRKSNRAMIQLNKKYGFQIIRTSAGYYHRPPEETVVMELLLQQR